MLRLIVMVAVVSVSMLGPAAAQNTTISSFAKAKDHLWGVFSAQPKTFYCGCDFDRGGPDWASCQFQAKKDRARASRIEWEHVVPASVFGRQLSAWTQGDRQCVSRTGKPYKGRKCAEKVSQRFRLMQADMYNLQPAIGEVNGLRSNYPYGEIAGEPRDFGACDMEIRGQVAEPKEAIRGDIARTYFYMQMVYPDVTIYDQTIRVQMEAWDRADPVDAWECQRNTLIQNIQKSRNPILDRACSQAVSPVATSAEAAPSPASREPALPAAQPDIRPRPEKRYKTRSGAWGDQQIKDNF